MRIFRDFQETLVHNPKADLTGAGKKWIFAVTFLAASPPRIAEDVDVRRPEIETDPGIVAVADTFFILGAGFRRWYTPLALLGSHASAKASTNGYPDLGVLQRMRYVSCSSGDPRPTREPNGARWTNGDILRDVYGLELPVAKGQHADRGSDQRHLHDPSGDGGR